MVKGLADSPNGYEESSVQYPISAEDESIRVKDIDFDRSDNGGFVPLAGREGDGTVADYFNSLTTVNCNDSSDNPKEIKVQFQRTIQTARIGFGCDDLSKNFGSIGETITVELIGSGDQVRTAATGTITNGNSFVIDFPGDTSSQSANGVVIKFNTANEVCLSNLIIYKSVNVNSRLQASQDDGKLIDAKATNSGNLKVSINEYGDTPAIDAFARQRISEPFTIFDSKQLHDKQPLFWDESIGGSATSTHTPADADVQMVVTASASDFVIRQTKQRFNYQPGKSQLIFMTFNSDQETGVTKRIGPFDGTGTNNLTPNNGIFFETNSNISWNIAKNGTTAETALQDDWNIDKLDGTGTSGITLDTSAAQILIVDYEWLGVGRVRVGFVIGGLIYYVHDFNHANDPAFPSVYMSTPNLPCRYDIQSDGTGGGELDHICSTVISEGGIEKTGVLRSIETGDTFSTGFGTNEYGLLGIRLKDDYKDVTVIPEGVKAVIGTNDSFKYTLQLNPTVGGALTWISLDNSSIEYAIGGTGNQVTSKGLIVGAGGGSTSERSASESLETALRIGSNIDGTKDTLFIAFRPFTSNTSVWAALDVRELL